jgi:hypothetical protein
MLMRQTSMRTWYRIPRMVSTIVSAKLRPCGELLLLYSTQTHQQHNTRTDGHQQQHEQHVQQHEQHAASLIEQLDARFTTIPPPHLDFKYFRDHKEQIRSNIQQRNALADIDGTVEAYEAYTNLKSQADQLRRLRKKNQLQASSGEFSKDRAVQLGQELRKQLATLDEQMHEIESKMLRLGLAIPNALHPSVPIGPEQNATVLKQVSAAAAPLPDATTITSTSTTGTSSAKAHLHLAELHDLVDFQQVRCVTHNMAPQPSTDVARMVVR